MENEEMMDYETIVIPMEDGKDEECAILATFMVDDKEYIVVSPIVDDELSDDAYMFALTREGDDMIIDNIEDDDEYEKAAKAYEELE